jgi:ABC-2 type transport system ATP-binding protein
MGKLRGRVLIARDLQKRFGLRTALTGISFDVKAGEIFGLLGQNGAGKSTFIGLACGLLQPDAGSISVCGLGPPHRPENRQSLGIAPQEIALYPDLSVAENLALIAKVYGLRGAKMREQLSWALDFSALADRAQTRVRYLSGGMARRLNLAAALIHDPQLILLDEPTAGVDPQCKESILASLLLLKHQGKTIVYTSHDLADTERICDRVAILHAGRIIAIDDVASIRARVTKTHVIEATIAGDHHRLTSHNIDADIRDLLEKGPLQNLSVSRPTLQEAFIQLTAQEDLP